MPDNSYNLFLIFQGVINCMNLFGIAVQQDGDAVSEVSDPGGPKPGIDPGSQVAGRYAGYWQSVGQLGTAFGPGEGMAIFRNERIRRCDDLGSVST